MKPRTKAIFLSGLGSALEYYDFIIYAVFAKIISTTFFPANLSPWLSLIMTFGILAAGYIARPIGGIIFGHLGDTRGRKVTFISTIVCMAVPSLLIGLLPGYSSLGALAPVLLLILRIFQGFSVGGELPGSLVYSIEFSSNKHRAFTCSLIYAGVNLGIFVAYAISYFSTHYFNNIWSWRIAFIIGGLLGVFNFYLRKRLAETPLFVKATSVKHFPLVILFKKYCKQLGMGIGLALLGAVTYSVAYLYMPTYLLSYFAIPIKDFVLMNMVLVIIVTLEQILFSYYADFFGRKKILACAGLLIAVLSVPLLSLLSPGNTKAAIIIMVVFSLINGMQASAYPAMLLELFPTQVRYSGYAVSYNVAFTVFSGMTPLLLTTLIHATHNLKMPAWYLSICGVIAFFVALKAKDDYRADLKT